MDLRQCVYCHQLAKAEETMDTPEIPSPCRFFSSDIIDLSVASDDHHNSMEK